MPPITSDTEPASSQKRMRAPGTGLPAGGTDCAAAPPPRQMPKANAVGNRK